MTSIPEAVTRKYALDRPLAEGGFGAVWLDFPLVRVTLEVGE